MNFTQQHFQYTFAGIGYLAAAIFSVSIGAIVLLQQPTSRKHIAFFLITFAGTNWLAGYAFLNFFKNPDYAMLGLRLCYLFGVPHLSPSAYFFSLELSGQPYKRKNLWFSYGLATFLGIFFFIFYADIVAIQRFSWGVLNSYLVSNPIGLGYLIAVLTHMFVYALLAYRSLRKGLMNASSPIERRQFQNFIFSFCIGYLSTTDYLVSVGVTHYAIGYITFSAFVGIVAYTVARHKFLDVNLKIKRFSLIFFIYSFLLAILLPLVVPILIGILNQSNKAAFQIFSLSMGIGLILSLGPIIYAYLVRNSFWLRGQFTTGLTHELKSPLSVIHNAADMTILQIENPAFNKKYALEYLGMIQENTRRLEDYVNDLLHVAHDQRNIAITKTRVNLQALLNNVQKTYSPLYAVAGIGLKISVDIPDPIEMDANKIEQVLSNILSNALKFSKQGPVELSAKTMNHSLLLSVRDRGIGIPKHLQEKIFDRFFQIDPGKKGSGIGLTIAKAWVEAHGGKIWAESDGERKGTTVTFTLPI